MAAGQVQTYLNISQFLFGIVLLNHYIACCWYGVGASQVTEDMDPRESWVPCVVSDSARASPA